MIREFGKKNIPGIARRVRLFSFLTVWIAVVNIQIGIAQTSPALPTIKTKDLNGRALTLPRELPGEKTVVLVAFTQEQQFDVDTWVNGLDLKIDGTGLPWVEMPVVGEMPVLVQAIVNNGMRGGIPQKGKRANVVTLFTDAKKWSKSVGLASQDRVYALVVDRSGKILAKQDGRYSAEKRGAILDAMRP